MTIAEANRFYEQDEKKYILKNNKEFLRWLDNSIDNGYYPFISIEQLQSLIDNIVNWYEIKYPEREFKYYEGTRFFDFKDIKKISNVMDIKQLLFRLPHKQLCLMECGYRARGFGQQPIYKDGKMIDLESEVFMSINKNNSNEEYSYLLPHFIISADNITGEVFYNYDLRKYIDSNEPIILDELLEIFKNKYSEDLDFSELEECVNNHNCDMELRHRILQLTALKMMYSDNTIPERGYERAKRFINEFNKKLKLTLSTEEIDDIIHRDYTNGEKWEFVPKSYIDHDGNEHSYLIFENVSKKENGRVRKLVKKIFRDK